MFFPCKMFICDPYQWYEVSTLIFVLKVSGKLSTQKNTYCMILVSMFLFVLLEKKIFTFKLLQMARTMHFWDYIGKG